MAKKKAPTKPYAAAIEALDAAPRDVVLEVDGEEVPITHLDKLLWPPEDARKLAGYTRRDYMRHLLRVGPYMLPHVVDRPLTLIRMPEGITKRRFVHFHYEHRMPRFVKTAMIYSENNKIAEEFLLCNNMATLLWLAHVGTLELHVWHSRVSTTPDARGASTDYASSLASLQASILSFPDYIVFDIDPYIYAGHEAAGAQPEFNERAFEQAKSVAFWLKELLDAVKLEAFLKTSGKTGLHVLVPIVRTVNYDAVRAIARTFAKQLATDHPKEITLDWDTRKRTGKIFLDYQMNVRVKTLNPPYSVRGLYGAPVSMPLTWKTLEKAHPMDYTMANAADLLERRGDIWAGIVEAKQDLAALLRASS